MDRSEAANRITELKLVLRENSKRYYVDNAPTMSDFEFDSLMRELEDLERDFPELKTDDSPTQRVGSDLETSERGNFVQRPHRYPMLSLSNTYSIPEIEEFAARADKSLETDFSYCCELKFDGTAICLTYRDGKLFRALTRGDGVKGDDVTENVRRIPDIPQELHGDFPPEFEIRGEILMPYDAFDRLNEERELSGEAPFANPRNAASGSLKLIDPEEVAHRGLVCTLYHIPAQSLDFETHYDALSKAASWGLPVSEHRKICRNIGQVEEYISHWDIRRHRLPFATDGIVIKINEMSAQRSLGYTAKSPRWAVAYKFKAEQACTPVLSIDYQVGRTGAVTPVANLEPVFLSGTMVRRATLNNADQMALLDIRVGDYVYVEKGGEIIPKITCVAFEKRPLSAVKPEFPANCPDCGTPLVKEEDEAKWFCPNSDGCPQQIKGRLLHFMSRKAMDIIGGESGIDQLYQLNLAVSPADLYDLTASQLLTLEGWKEKSAARLLDSIKKSRAVPFARVLYALGIRYVGEITAKELADHFGKIDAIAAASREELLEVADIGEVTASSVYDFLHDERHLKEVERLKAAGLNFSQDKKAPGLSDALKGKTIVISGNFSVSRDEIKELISLHGGKNSASVSGSTSFLLAGSKAGPEKLRKCGQLGIEILSEEQFMELLPSEKKVIRAQETEPTLF